MPKKKVLAKKTDSFIFHSSEKALLKEEIRKLHGIIEELKKELKKYSTIKHRLEFLENFYNRFCYYCIGEKQRISVVRCAKIIENSECRFYSNCNERNSLLELLRLK